MVDSCDVHQIFIIVSLCVVVCALLWGGVIRWFFFCTKNQRYLQALKFNANPHLRIANGVIFCCMLGLVLLAYYIEWGGHYENLLDPIWAFAQPSTRICLGWDYLVFVLVVCWDGLLLLSYLFISPKWPHANILQKRNLKYLADQYKTLEDNKKLEVILKDPT